jgi:outer membrane protein OmpA-like peptidoglycan-associated protein
MKSRLFVVVLSSAMLTLPLAAQQSTSTSQPAAGDQTVASHETATGQAPLAPANKEDFWAGDQPGVAWLILHPYASKGYVKRHLQAVQDRVNELDELSANNAKSIKDVDGRAQQGIQLASAKADMADQHATDASNKAQAAQQAANQLNGHVTMVETSLGKLDDFQSSKQTEIRFRAGQTVLSKPAKDALDDMAAQLKDQHGYIIEVQGYSTGQGQAAIANSRKIADSVVRYLVLNHEIPAYRIYVVGMGNAPVSSEDGKHIAGNRVEVSLLKNGLEQAANQ